MINTSIIQAAPTLYSPAARRVTNSEPVDGFVGTVSLEAPPQLSVGTVGARVSPTQQQDLGAQVARSLGAPVAASLSVRDSQEAVRFVSRFNSELKLPAERLEKRNTMMVSSPAKFLRMNPALFYQDVKGPYAPKASLLDRPAPVITIAGDCHMGNLGAMRGPAGKTMWGINDFDMAGQGSPASDLERMATSILLMGQESGLSETDTLSLVSSMADAYRGEIATQSQGGPSTVSGIEQQEAYGPVKEAIEKGAGRSQQHLLKKYAVGSKLLRNEELKDISSEEDKLVRQFLVGYDQTQGATPDIMRPIHLLDCAHRMDAGGSTFGLNRFFCLVEGSAGLPVILELKQELPTGTETSTGDLSKADAQHIFQGMQALGGTNNPLMAAAPLNGGAYFVREREREKTTVDLAKLDVDGWKAVVEQAGQAVARAHAHQPGVAHSIHAWIGQDQALLTAGLQDFARSYAEQTRQDMLAYSQSLGA